MRTIRSASEGTGIGEEMLLDGQGRPIAFFNDGVMTLVAPLRSAPRDSHPADRSVTLVTEEDEE